MPSFTLFDDSSVARSLDFGEFAFIGETGNLTVNGDAISSSLDVLISVFGTLTGRASAVEHAGGFFNLFVGDTGRVGSGLGNAVNVDNARGALLRNDGAIRSSEGSGLSVESGGSLSILNNGSLTAERVGIIAAADDERMQIVNNGTIDAGFDGINTVVERALIINRGTISGANSYGIDAADRADELRNNGSTTGDVVMRAGRDTVINSGVMDTVDLGDGADIYIGRRDGRAVLVDGAGGRDRLLSSRSDDTFAGGDDRDTFVFAVRGGDDRIVDFDEADRIDLVAFGFSSFGADVRDHVEDRPRGVLIDLSDQGLTIFVRGVEAADLRGADFIL
jgi:hypothetical protein